PAWSGVALAAAGGALFYPLFFVPAWIGYFWPRARDLRRFLVGFGVASLLLGGSVLLMSRPAGGKGLVGTIINDTIGHQESLAACAMGAHLWKIHETGTYVAWYFPLLLIGLFCDAGAPQARLPERSGDHGAPRAEA